MNKIFIIGRISTDLELRATESGKSVVNFNIAVNRVKEGVDFIPVQVWNAPAENLCKYQLKGNLISVEGTLRIDTYEDKDGNKRNKTYVLANNIEYLQTKSKEENVTEQIEEKDPFEDFGESVSIDDNLLD